MLLMFVFCLFENKTINGTTSYFQKKYFKSLNMLHLKTNFHSDTQLFCLNAGWLIPTITPAKKTPSSRTIMFFFSFLFFLFFFSQQKNFKHFLIFLAAMAGKILNNHRKNSRRLHLWTGDSDSLLL